MLRATFLGLGQRQAGLAHALAKAGGRRDRPADTNYRTLAEVVAQRRQAWRVVTADRQQQAFVVEQ
ncbi:hypothetical protein D3C71_1829020 [compost metagenome]